MPLTADLAVRLDASTLVQDFLTQMTQSSAALIATPNPVDPTRLAAASTARSAFTPAPILDAIHRFASVALPTIPLPVTLQRIDGLLTSIEGLTTSDLSADMTALAQQLSTLLESANPQGVPDTILQVFDLLKGSPTGSALGPIVARLTSGLQLPEALGDYLPAFAASVRVLAGLMVYETVLAEGERLTGIVAGLFDAERARREANNLQAALRFGDRSLAQALAGADPTDEAHVDGLVAAVEHAAAQLDDLETYVSRGMGFGEATLVHFNVSAAQAEIAAAGALLRDPDLGSLRRVFDALARQAQPFVDLLDPKDAAARGMEEILQLAEAQVDEAVSAMRALDAQVLVAPLTQGLPSITAPLRDFSNLIAQMVNEVRAVLEQVRAAVAALPIDDLASAIRSALEPVTRALQLVQELVNEIRVALERAAQTALANLGQIEHGVDQFQQQIAVLFEQARLFVDDLHLDQVVSGVTDQVNEFVALLQQAHMKPYFDTASIAIGSAAELIDTVPIELLPDSMKAELDTALAPVRAIDPQAVKAHVETLLGIGTGGEFQLRGDLEDALAAVQAKFNALLATLDEHHPGQYLDQIDTELAVLSTRIQSLVPELTLQPMQQAIAQVKSTLGSFDLARELAPVQAVFDSAMQSLDQYSPAQLLQPLEQRVVAARQALENAIRINDWRPTLDGLVTMVLAELDVLDPAAVETLLRTQVEALQAELDNLSDIGLGNWLGMVVAGLMRGSQLRIVGSSINSVMHWTQSGSASTELSARASRISEAIANTRREVEAFSPAALSAIVPTADATCAAAASLASSLGAGSERRIRLEAGANRLDPARVLGELTANRTRYLDLLGSAATLGDALRRTGMSEADVAVEQLRQACTPLSPLFAKSRQLAAYLGVRGTQTGFGSVLGSIFRVATPARLSGLVMKLVVALRDRLTTLIDEVLAPVRAAIDDLKHLIDLLDLQPVIDGIQNVFVEVRNQLLAYSPTVLLADQLLAFGGLKQDLLAFDPLASILLVLNGLRDTAARVLQKLSARKLLEAVLATYDTILNAIRQLDIATLLTPVLDTLDAIAQQVNQGLDETVDAFKRLQAALPPPSAASASVVVA